MSKELSNSPETVWITDRRASGAVQARSKTQKSKLWRGVELLMSTEDISNSVVWFIRENRHAVVVHLGGTIDQLETELNGCGACLDPPMAGEAWIIPAGERYTSHAHGNVVQYAELYIDPDFLVQLLGHSAEVTEIPPRAAKCDEFMYRSVQYLAELMDKTDDLSQMICLSVSQALCLHLLRKYSSSRRDTFINYDTPRFTPKDAQLLLEYVHNHLGDRITLEALSKLVRMSTHNLLIAFPKSFGTTPAQYVIEERLRRVRWLLSNTRKDVTSIAVETGFASHSHLTATFKKHIGLTPSEFRVSRLSH